MLVAECPDGIGPLDVVNEAIFRIGVLPRLAPGVTLGLVSSLDRAEVARTLLTPLDAVPRADDMLVVPRASHLLCDIAP